MKTNLKLALLTISVTLLIPVTSHAGPPIGSEGRIEGRILDLRGYTMRGVNVLAIGESTRERYLITSNDGGGFIIERVYPERYTLATRCAGIERAISTVSVGPGQTASVEM